MCGGQWPQARKAKVKQWGISDSRCQLCHKETGTIEHRFSCECTKPEGGWHEPAGKAKEGLDKIGEERKALLRTQGLVCIKIPRHKRYPNGVCNWLTAALDVTRNDLSWYTDGSCSDPTCHEIAKLGFGIVVIGDEGSLVAYGAGITPSHVADSGMAELSAVWTAIEMSPTVPRIITDCLGILNTA